MLSKKNVYICIICALVVGFIIITIRHASLDINVSKAKANFNKSNIFDDVLTTHSLAAPTILSPVSACNSLSSPFLMGTSLCGSLQSSNPQVINGNLNALQDLARLFASGRSDVAGEFLLLADNCERNSEPTEIDKGCLVDKSLIKRAITALEQRLSNLDDVDAYAWALTKFRSSDSLLEITDLKSKIEKNANIKTHLTDTYQELMEIIDEKFSLLSELQSENGAI
jgi:hypothetical protein